MQALADADILRVWEKGYALHPIDQGLLLLSAFFPQSSSDVISEWPLGRRNTALAELRCQWFGARALAWTACEQCGEKMEFEVDIAAVAKGVAAEDGVRDVRDSATDLIEFRGRKYRLPSSRDLACALRGADVSGAALQIAHSCLIDRETRPAMTDADLAALGELMARADPMAEITFELRCPDCGQQGSTLLDLASFVWSEVEALAKHRLLDVHQLAAAYGWSEQAILNMHALRRAYYLSLVHG